MVDYIADYLENIRERRVFPDVKPGLNFNPHNDCIKSQFVLQLNKVIFINKTVQLLGTVAVNVVVEMNTTGYMRELLPEDPPTDGEAWDKIFKDVEGVIMPGVNILGLVKIHKGLIGL